MALRLMAILAHPDDESLGFGGTLAHYAAGGIELSLITATRGERGRYRGHRDAPEHPGQEALGRIREAELRAAATTLGIEDLTVLNYVDQDLDRADPAQLVGIIAHHVRRVRPDVVMTFPPDGAYGHPDHIAISQAAAGGIVAAAASTFATRQTPAYPAHTVSKLYYLAWPRSVWDAYQEAFRALVSTVDGVTRQASPWPEWAITTTVDTRAHWETVWRAVSCHASQIAAYERLLHVPPSGHEALWGRQSFYRVFSLVNGGRDREYDLFEGLR